MKRWLSAVVLLGSSAVASGHPCAGGTQRPQADATTVAVETTRGRFGFTTFPDEAPVTVAHIIALVKTPSSDK